MYYYSVVTGSYYLRGIICTTDSSILHRAVYNLAITVKEVPRVLIMLVYADGHRDGGRRMKHIIPASSRKLSKQLL